MRWKRILLWSAAGVTTALVVVLVWAWTADLGVLKPRIERFVSAASGRAFSIDGPLRIRLGRTSTIVARAVRLANPEWAGPQPMLELGHLEVHIDTLSILDGPLRLEYVDVADVVLDLRRDAAGAANWSLGSSTEPDDRPDGTGGELPLVIDELDLANVRVRYQAPGRDAPLRVNVDSAVLRTDPTHRLTIAADGAIGDRVAAVRGHVGTMRALTTGENVEFDLDGRLGNFAFTGRGHLDHLLRPARPRLELSARGPDVNELGAALGLGPLGEGDASLSATLGPGSNGALRLSVAGHLGRTEVSATGRASDLRRLEAFELSASLAGPDPSGLFKLAGIPRPHPSPFRVAIDAERDGASLVIRNAELRYAGATAHATAELPAFPALHDGHVELLLEGPDSARFRELLALPGLAAGPFTIAAALRPGDAGAETLSLSLATTLATFEAQGRLGDGAHHAGTTATFHARSDSLDRVLRAAGQRGFADVAVDLTGAVELTDAGLVTREPVVVRVGSARATFDGQIPFAPQLRGLATAFTLSGPDLNALVNDFATVATLPSAAYDLKGRLAGRSDALALRELHGVVGRSTVSGDGLITYRPGIEGSRFSLRADGPAFEEVVAAVPGLAVRPGRYALAGTVRMEAAAVALEDVRLDRADHSLDLRGAVGLPAGKGPLSFELAGRGADIRSLFQGSGGFATAAQPFSLLAAGELRGQRLRISRLDGALGDASATGHGDLTLDLADGSLQLGAAIPSLAALGTLNGRALLDEPLRVDATVVVEAGTFVARNVDLELAESHIRGTLRFTPGPIPDIAVDVVADTLRLRPLLEPRPSASAAPSPALADGLLIPDMVLPLARLEDFDARVTVNVGSFESGLIYLEGLELLAEVADGTLRLPRAVFGTHWGRVEMSGELAAAAGAGRASLELRAEDAELVLLAGDLDHAMSGDVGIRLSSSGTDVRALAANANGTVFIDARGGRIAPHRFLRALYGDALNEIVSTINPFSKASTHTEFDCIVLPLRLDAGRLRSTVPALVRTDKLNMFFEPAIDLATEKIDVSVRTTPRTGLVLSASEIINPYVKIVGTLARPRLAVDERGVLISGGAAVASGGLTIIAKGLWDRMTRSKDPCGDVAAQGVAALGALFPDLPPPGGAGP